MRGCVEEGGRPAGYRCPERGSDVSTWSDAIASPRVGRSMTFLDLAITTIVDRIGDWQSRLGHLDVPAGSPLAEDANGLRLRMARRLRTRCSRRLSSEQLLWLSSSPSNMLAVRPSLLDEALRRRTATASVADTGDERFVAI